MRKAVATGSPDAGRRRSIPPAVRTLAAAALALVLVTLGACHSPVADVPLTTQTIYFSDKFFDVKATGPDSAIVVGYGGKIVQTTDGGTTFTRLESGTDFALYRILMRGMKGWIVGQEGLILHTEDGGKTWQKQVSGTQNYLFSADFVDDEQGFAVGDRSTLVETSDGGKTWTPRHVVLGEADANADAELALAMQDPIFYDVRFADASTGWISGEFGRLAKTTDGGKTWSEQQDTLMTREAGIAGPMDMPTFFGAFASSPQEALAVGIDGRIARTRDGGATWRFEPMKLAFPIIDPLFQAVVTPDGHAWVVGAAGEVVHLPAGETQWTRPNLGMPIYTWLRSLDFSDSQHGWIVGGYGTVLRTSDGGKSWRPCFG